MSASEDDDLSPAEDNTEVIEEPENVERVEGAENDQTAEPNENQQDGEDAEKKEVKIKRVRNPQPKLNAERLRGPRGLLMLQDLFKNVKFKGRGHEEEDLGVLMKNYEYWCHRLFPKFPFDDCLETMERLGTKRPVQVYVKKIRMDLVCEEPNAFIENNPDDDTERNVEDSQTSEFENLLQDSQQSSGAVSAGLTDDQLERIRINRERAQRLRQQMLIRNKEKASADFLSTATVAQIHNDPESAATSSQNSNLSDILKQIDFTETMSTDSEPSGNGQAEAMSVDSSMAAVENMSIGSETFVSQMSVVAETQLSIENMAVASTGDENVNSQISEPTEGNGSQDIQSQEIVESGGSSDVDEAIESSSKAADTAKRQDCVDEKGEQINLENDDLAMEVDIP